MNEAKIINGVKLILQGLELDPTDRNYIKTPWRVLGVFKELFGKPTQFPPVYEEQYDEMIVMKHHTTWGMCPHHLLPVALDISIAYVPRGGVVGLSKMARIAEMCLSKPVLQESLTHQIVDTMMDKIKPTPNGAGCVVEGKHLCMAMRGVKSTGTVTTSAMRGVFLDKPATREEFLNLVRNSR